MKRIKSKKIQENYVICNDSYKRGYEEGYKRYKNHSDKDYISWGFEGIIIANVCWILMISLIQLVITSIPELSWLSSNPIFSFSLFPGSFVIHLLLLYKIFFKR